MRLFIVVTLLFAVETSHAWGRRGHSVVGNTAAYILSQETKDNFYQAHSFDLSYYSNTPDFVWKEPASFAKEHPQHFIDKEIFDRELKNYKGSDPFALSREEFDSKFPNIAQNAGRSWWRIREINDLLSATTKKLNEKELTKEQRFEAQANWLLLSGVISHYVGDLGMPLHVSENHNGQLTGQEGIHAFFEEAIVDEMYGALEQRVLQEAKKRWAFFHKKNANTPLLTLIKEMSAVSFADMPELLKIDKKIGHRDAKKGVQAFKGMIEERITVASLYLAEVLIRQTSWTPDNNKFYNIIFKAPYIEPGSVATIAPTASPAEKK
jgi:hypothetical protein